MKKVGAAQRPERGADRPLILYVEDEDENWQVTELRLRARYSLVRARDDREACTAVRSFGQRLAAVLMDIQLKGSQLDGIELCHAFKGRPLSRALPDYARDLPRLQAPILFVTAFGARYSEEELRRLGGEVLIHKPVDFIRLMLALANASARGAANLFAG